MTSAFPTARRGYDRQAVDLEIDRLQGYAQAMQNAMADLRAQNERLEAQLSAYHAQEAAMREALLAAGQLRREMLAGAAQQVQQARAEAEQLVGLFAGIKKEAERTLERVEFALKAQLELLERLKKGELPQTKPPLGIGGGGQGAY